MNKTEHALARSLARITRVARITRLTRTALMAAAVVGSAAVAAQSPTRTSPPTAPTTTVRVGGSPADESFRRMQRESGDRYRDALAACKARPSAERGTCKKDAQAELKRARTAAEEAHAKAR